MNPFAQRWPRRAGRAHPTRDASVRSRSVPSLRVSSFAALLGLLMLAGCGEESFESELCKDLPQYSIRKADAGAVKEDGLVANSPLTAPQQRKLQELEAAGCITLPRFRPTLKD